MNEEQQKKNIICHCVQVSEFALRKEIQSGNTTLEGLKKSLHVASTCKFCAVDIADIMKDEGVLVEENELI